MYRVILLSVWLPQVLEATLNTTLYSSLPTGSSTVSSIVSPSYLLGMTVDKSNKTILPTSSMETQGTSMSDSITSSIRLLSSSVLSKTSETFIANLSTKSNSVVQLETTIVLLHSSSQTLSMTLNATEIISSNFFTMLETSASSTSTHGMIPGAPLSSSVSSSYSQLPPSLYTHPPSSYRSAMDSLSSLFTPLAMSSPVSSSELRGTEASTKTTLNLTNNVTTVASEISITSSMSLALSSSNLKVNTHSSNFSAYIGVGQTISASMMTANPSTTSSLSSLSSSSELTSIASSPDYHTSMSFRVTKSTSPLPHSTSSTKEIIEATVNTTAVSIAASLKLASTNTSMLLYATPTSKNILIFPSSSIIRTQQSVTAPSTYSTSLPANMSSAEVNSSPTMARESPIVSVSMKPLLNHSSLSQLQVSSRLLSSFQPSHAVSSESLVQGQTTTTFAVKELKSVGTANKTTAVQIPRTISSSYLSTPLDQLHTTMDNQMVTSISTGVMSHFVVSTQSSGQGVSPSVSISGRRVTGSVKDNATSKIFLSSEVSPSFTSVVSITSSSVAQVIPRVTGNKRLEGSLTITTLKYNGMTFKTASSISDQKTRSGLKMTIGDSLEMFFKAILDDETTNVTVTKLRDGSIKADFVMTFRSDKTNNVSALQETFLFNITERNSTLKGRNLQMNIAKSGLSLSDVNECTSGLSRCHDKASCINIPLSYKCSCMDGYLGNGFHCKEEKQNIILIVGITLAVFFGGVVLVLFIAMIFCLRGKRNKMQSLDSVSSFGQGNDDWTNIDWDSIVPRLRAKSNYGLAQSIHLEKYGEVNSGFAEEAEQMRRNGKRNGVNGVHNGNQQVNGNRQVKNGNGKMHYSFYGENEETTSI